MRLTLFARTFFSPLPLVIWLDFLFSLLSGHVLLSSQHLFALSIAGQIKFILEKLSQALIILITEGRY